MLQSAYELGTSTDKITDKTTDKITVWITVWKLKY